MAINLVRVKIVAVLLQPAGVGITNQATNLLNTLTVLLFLGLGPGVAKFLAAHQAEGDDEAAARVVTTSSVALLLSSVIGLIVGVLLAQPLAAWAFEDAGFTLLVLISLAGVPLAVFYNLGRAFLQGHKEVRAIAVANVASALLSFATVIPLVRLWGITGAVINISLTWGLNAAFYWRFWLRRGGRSLFRRSAFDWPVLRELVRYGAASLAVGAATSVALLVVRRIVIAELGADANGLYQAVYGLSVQYMTLVTGAMATYSFAQLSGIASRLSEGPERRQELHREINNNLRLVLLVIVPVLAAVVLFRRLGLIVFYSPAFLPAAPLFPLHALGDLFMALAWAFGLALLPLGRVAGWLLINLSAPLVLLGGASLLLPGYGLQGLVIAYALAQALQAALSWGYLSRVAGFRLSQRNTRLLVVSVLTLSAMTLLAGDSALRYALSAMFLLLWLVLAPSREELRHARLAAQVRVRRLIGKLGGGGQV
jgi:O-antigen/teichoic acid export membrane protein